MANLSFEAETHPELVAKVKRWLASTEGNTDAVAADVINRSAEVTKDALRVIASAAPEPVAQSEVVKSLTAMGYQVTDSTAKAMIDALDSLSSLTNGGLLKRARNAQTSAVFQMNQAVAKQILKALVPRAPKSTKT
ncbi:MAG: hypothetical protein QOD72_2170 [Acidimicrobiaceae bacterium]|jgi:hypothetical protein|nr:hypothetical protein [Acidimicrobiaceae bacterium]